jgi:hypothetical protein
VVNEGAWFSYEDIRQIDKDKQELDILKDIVTTLEEANLNLTKQNEDLIKEAKYQKQLTDIAEREAAASDKAFQQMKEISDKWQELAKATQKPKISFPQILGGIIAGIIAGIFIAK